MQIREAFRDNTKHEGTRKIYSAFNIDTEKELRTRKDQVTIAQLRAGKHRPLMSYMIQIDGDKSPKCPWCKEEDHTVEHWFLKCQELLRAEADPNIRSIGGGVEESSMDLFLHRNLPLDVSFLKELIPDDYSIDMMAFLHIICLR